MDLPKKIGPTRYLWVNRRKICSISKVKTYKAKLVAKVYSQKEEIDYKETFLPVAMIKSI